MSATMQNNVNFTNNNNLITKYRQDFAIIAGWVNFGGKVLDLGCGDGTLLQFLRSGLEVKGYGVEKDDANWLVCMQNGTNVIQMDLEDGLSGFDTNHSTPSFCHKPCKPCIIPKKLCKKCYVSGAKLSLLSLILAIGVTAFKLPVAAICQCQKTCLTSGLIHLMYICVLLTILTNFVKITKLVSSSAK